MAQPLLATTATLAWWCRPGAAWCTRQPAETGSCAWAMRFPASHQVPPAWVRRCWMVARAPAHTDSLAGPLTCSSGSDVVRWGNDSPSGSLSGQVRQFRGLTLSVVSAGPGPTTAAGLTAFAGDGTTTAQYLTTRQGQRYFTGLIHAATDSVQDAHAQLHGKSTPSAPITSSVSTGPGSRRSPESRRTSSTIARTASCSGTAPRSTPNGRHGRCSDATRSGTGSVSVHQDGSVLGMHILT